MVSFSHIFFSLSLTGLALSAVVKQRGVTDIFLDVYGPFDNWIPIKLLDKFPNAKYNGKLADSSIIYGYELPANITLAQRDEVDTRLNAGRISSKAKRQGCVTTPGECYKNGNWVYQQQLVSATDTFCQDASGTLNGGTYHQWKNLYWNSASNSWMQFSNAYNRPNTVTFEIINFRPYFDYTACVNGFRTIIGQCHGEKPDSAGGWMQNAGCAGINIMFDPWDSQ